MKRRERVVVIGGGVIGVCSAYYLASAGRRVTLVERDSIASGCSYGNAGLIVPSHSIPLSTPANLLKALKWFFDRNGPFYVRPRLNKDLMTWLWYFFRSCTLKKVRNAIPLIRDLTQASLDLYTQLARTVLPQEAFDYRKSGLLVLARDRKGFRDLLKECCLLRNLGIDNTPLHPSEVLALESAVSPTIQGGAFFPDDAQLLPAEFVRALAQAAEKKGVEVLTSTVVQGFETNGKEVSAVKTNTGTLLCDHVILAAGAASARLSASLGVPLLIQPAKGYSITIRKPEKSPRVPLLCSEDKVAVTPMGSCLRYSGMLDLTGPDCSIMSRRIDAIKLAANRYMAAVGISGNTETWCGLRPCSPDGLPFIGESKKYRNITVATGHGMLGMSLGPVTGKLIAQIVNGEPSLIDLALVSPDRFAS